MTSPLEAECVLCAGATLAEGPVWDAARRVLWWVDILEAEVHRFDPATGEDRALRAGGRVGAVALRTDGSLLAAAGRELVVIDPETAERRPLGAALRLSDGLRFNDGKCDPAGRFWIGSMGREAEPGRGALHCVRPDGSAERVLEGLTIPNGLAWSADARAMYFIDSPEGVVRVFDQDPDTGGLSKRRDAVRLPEGAAPDGMTIDEEGMLWVAEWGAGSLSRYDPADGRRLATARLPALQVTSCTFGGEDGGDLYVTTAREHFTAEDARRQPLAGSLFRLRPGVRGRPPHRFRG